MVFPSGFEDGVGSFDGHAKTGQLVFMDPITTALWGGFHQANDIDAGLQSMITCDQPYIAPADYE